MTASDSLRQEFALEARTTRRHLERLPEDRLDWRPHEKSFTLIGLASHIVDCVGWFDAIFGGDMLDVDPADYKPFQAGSATELIEAFDRNAAACERALSNVADEALGESWRLEMLGRVRFEKPRAAVFRDFTLSHMIHHRGQLSVYLRLLDIPVPGSYGPTADEKS